MPLIGERPELDFNAVVYGTDFSVFCQNAGLYAALLASHFSTALMVAHAHRQILENIRERSVDLLVLGIRKSSHLGIKTRTSRAFQLIAHATCPVLTIVG